MGDTERRHAVAERERGSARAHEVESLPIPEQNVDAEPVGRYREGTKRGSGKSRVLREAPTRDGGSPRGRVGGEGRTQEGAAGGEALGQQPIESGDGVVDDEEKAADEEVDREHENHGDPDVIENIGWEPARRERPDEHEEPYDGSTQVHGPILYPIPDLSRAQRICQKERGGVMCPKN